MIKLIRNEIKKIVLSRKYIISMGILILLCTIMTFSAYNDAMKSRPEVRLKSNNDFISYLNKEKEDKNTNEKRKSQIETQINELEIQNKQLEFEINNKGIDWNERIKKQNDNLAKQLEVAEKEQNYEAIAFYKQQIVANEYSLKNNIRVTPNYEITAFNMVPKVNIFVGMLVISLIIAIITADSISGEFNPATIKLLLTKPISREKAIFIKFISAIITCIASFIIVKLIMFIVIGVLFKFGSYKEPVCFYSRYIKDNITTAKLGYGVRADINSLKIYSVLSFTLISEGINCLYIIACTAFCFLISTLTKKTSSSISICVILIAISSVFETITLAHSGGNPIIHKIMPFFFSIYSSGELLISGEITSKIGLSYVNTYFALIILLAWIAICYFLSNLVFTKKDILC